MSVFTELSREDIESLLGAYTLGHYAGHQGISAGTENTNYFVDTDLSQFVLTVFEKHRPDELPFFLALGEHLHDAHCAVPQPFRTADGEFLMQVHGKPAVLFERVTGKHHQPSPDHAATVAGALGKIHQSTGLFSGQRLHSHGIGWIRERQHDLAPELNANDATLFDAALVRLEAIDRGLPQGVIHADLFHDNALFDDNGLAGIIDWYFAGTDLYALDIATCLIDWCLDAKGLPDPAQVRNFVDHYEQTRPLKPGERAAIPDLTIQAATRFWLSRELALRAHSGDGNVTQKDPNQMKRIVSHLLQNPLSGL
ncbi:homoserine kinase [Saccharospirillum impatiens]|uniref:homoserine kinase n=1 Tax=Saccharospirillum impatiens TaxID=169438 RepID=UPI00048DEF7A|nr:homoserine kinase [Saccharospirillum impatiens]